MLPERMSRAELRAGASLAGVYGLRMLGLFFILPVFAVHAAKRKGGGDLALVGIALGAYGLSQGILQIPFGLASDRWGRKPALYTGLVIFAAAVSWALRRTTSGPPSRRGPCRGPVRSIRWPWRSPLT